MLHNDWITFLARFKNSMTTYHMLVLWVVLFLCAAGVAACPIAFAGLWAKWWFRITYLIALSFWRLWRCEGDTDPGKAVDRFLISTCIRCRSRSGGSRAFTLRTCRDVCLPIRHEVHSVNRARRLSRRRTRDRRGPEFSTTFKTGGHVCAYSLS